AFFLTIPSVLKTMGSSSGQCAAVAVNSDATKISARVERATGRFVFSRCHAIQAPPLATAAIASFVIQPWAWSSTAIDPPASASRGAGRVNARARRAVHPTAASAVIATAAATLLPGFFGAGQAQPGEFSVGRRQDGPITLM